MAADVIELARRFEPVLHFHKDERFFPSDAKRYIEHCALWKAERPFNEKDSWGGKGQPFPRQPMIDHQKIAASDDERRPGDTWLGAQPFITDSFDETRFLELAGWQQSDPEAIVASTEGVDASSENRHAAFDAVADLYGSFSPAPGLRDSRFWYHVELFDTQHLRGLMNRERAPAVPDLWTLFTQLEPRNPALLCYYFFFPAHLESLPPPCDSMKTEIHYSSFVGEWACMAILLERPNRHDRYMPRWIGHTGRRNVGSHQGLDLELRIGMTVRRWQFQREPREDPLPRTIADHPKLFVALGTHSLYLDQGTHMIDPYPAGEVPQWCGQFDTPDALNEFVKSRPPQESNTAAVVKILGGLALGGLPGLVAGVVWTAMEGLPLGSGISAVGQMQPSSAQPDLAPGPGDFGTVVHPKVVSLTDPAGAEFVEWAADQNVVIETTDPAVSRTYDFIVDRTTQVWWPSDDGKSGYRGRWGPFVTNDFLGRRAGMLFPDFWRMFFVALAKKQPSS